MPSVPVDGRPQFDPATVMVANALMGRWLTDGVETVTPGGQYILKNTWPAPKASVGFSGTPAASTLEGKGASKNIDRPMTPARAIWPNLA
jgi:hypothetical protein